MRLTAGERIGPYEIASLLGAGGMGEVYRAHDPRIGRDVAIKILPESLSANRDRMQRFEQEARATGMLNHPNLLTVFDIGSHGEARYIVAEMLDGETLREKLNAGRRVKSDGSDSGASIPMRKAIEWAQQLASGLAAAHEKGVVHRDLKPENIFITRDGRVKILDFGLAKLLADPSASSITNAKTEERGTDPGTVLGTTGYMSPEQVRAQIVDHRSDIFSLGVILYEMFCGMRPFRGDSAADTMSAIVRDDPPEISSINRAVPPGIERIVRHCLEKNPEERFQSARDLSFDLSALSLESGTAARPTRAVRRVRIPLVVLACAASLVIGAVAAWIIATRSKKPDIIPRLRPLTYSGHDLSPDFSPDGKTVVFTSDRDGTSRIWLKELATGGEVPLTSGSDEYPRFSPDGSSVLYVHVQNQKRMLYRTAVVGGTPRRLLADVGTADFTPDGKQIVYLIHPAAATSETIVGIVSSDGSDPHTIATLPLMYYFPRVSPDGKWIAVSEVTTGNSPGHVCLVSLDGKVERALKITREFGNASSVAWIDAAHVVYSLPEKVTSFISSSTFDLFVYDIETDEATRVNAGIASQPINLDVAPEGRVVIDGVTMRENLREFDVISGKADRWLNHGVAMDRQPAYSPDGTKIVFSSSRSGNLDLWAIEASSGAVTRLTDDAADDFDPYLTRDGGHLLWSSNRSGNFEIWIADSDGSGARQLSHDGYDAENPTATPDGTWIVYNSYSGKPGVWKMRFDSSAPQRIFAGTTQLPEVSPDGRWVVFDSAKENCIVVAEVATGRSFTFSHFAPQMFATQTGRCRWRPDGNAIACVVRDDKGVFGVSEQQFVPWTDTSSTQKRLFGFDADAFVESFGYSPDGKRVTAALMERVDTISIIDNVPLQAK